MNGDIEEKNKRIGELEEMLKRVLQEAQANEPSSIQEKSQKVCSNLGVIEILVYQ